MARKDLLDVASAVYDLTDHVVFVSLLDDDVSLLELEKTGSI